MRSHHIALALLCASGLAAVCATPAYAQDGSGLRGNFTGTYQCAQGWSDVTLTVLADARTARFAFSGRGAEGAFIVSIVPLGNDTYDLVPLRWERAPRNYGMVGARIVVQGNSLTGRIANPSCGSIRASRSDDYSRQGMPADPVRGAPGGEPGAYARRPAFDRPPARPATGYRDVDAQRPSDPRGAPVIDMPRVSIFLSCRAGANSVAAESTASLAAYRQDLDLKAQRAGKLLSTVRNPDDLRREIAEAKTAIALTPYEQQQLDVSNAEVQRLQARGAFPLAARVKERNDRVLSQIVGTSQRRDALQRLQTAEAQLAAQGAMADQIRSVTQDYDRSRAGYEQGIRAILSGQPAAIASLHDYLALENDVALFSSCRSSAGADSTDVTFQSLAAHADPIVPELTRRVSEAITAGTNSSLLARSLVRYRASRALRLNPNAAAVIARADTSLAALEQKERRAQEMAEARAASAKRAAAEAAARAYASSDHGKLSLAAAAAFFRAPSLALARSIGLASLHQNEIDAVVAKYIFDTRGESCSRSAKGTLCTYEMQVSLATFFTIRSPWARRTDLFVNDGGILRSTALDAAMAVAATSSNSGGSTDNSADESNKRREECRMQNFGEALMGGPGSALPWAMC